MTHRRDQAGFTLLEVLVALLVLSVAVVAVLQLLGGGLRLAAASGRHLEATLLASAKLSETPVEDLQEGVTEGTEGDFRWKRQVVKEPIPEALLPAQVETGQATRVTAPAPQAPTVVNLARITVEVAWDRNRRLELVTLRAWGSRQ